MDPRVTRAVESPPQVSKVLFLERSGALMLDAHKDPGKFLPLLYLAAILSFVAITRVLQFPYCIDDAYIDFRHVKNLVEHFSLDYNPGKPVMGFTSHAHFLLLSLVAFLTGSRDIPVLARSVNLTLDLLNAALVFLLMEKWTKDVSAALFAAAFYGLFIYFIRESYYGKEAPLLVCFILVWLWGVSGERLALVGWASAAAFLTRPEGLFLGLAALLWGKQRFAWSRIFKAWIAPAAAVLAWYGVLYHHFGTVLPHGGVAKANQIYRIAPFSAARDMLDFFLSPLPMRGFPGSKLLRVAIMLSCLFAAYTMQQAFRLYAWAALAICAFYAFLNPVMFSWYYAWMAAAFLLCVPLAFHAWRRRVRAPFLAYLPAVLFLGGLAQGYPVRAIGGVKLHTPFFEWSNWHQRLVLYERAAEYLNAKAEPLPIVATAEPGMFGYTYRGRVLDLAGLVSDEMMGYFPVPPELASPTATFSIPPRAVSDLKPGYVLFYDTFAKNGLLNDAFFLKNYVEEQFWPLEIWGSRGLFLYQYRGTSDAAPAADP